MTDREKMHSGELYLPTDSEIMREQIRHLDMLYDFNQTRPTQLDVREKMLKEMFAEITEGCCSCNSPLDFLDNFSLSGCSWVRIRKF